MLARERSRWGRSVRREPNLQIRGIEDLVDRLNDLSDGLLRQFLVGAFGEGVGRQVHGHH